jgi:hypothetical protein
VVTGGPDEMMTLSDIFPSAAEFDPNWQDNGFYENPLLHDDMARFILIPHVFPILSIPRPWQGTH